MTVVLWLSWLKCLSSKQEILLPNSSSACFAGGVNAVLTFLQYEMEWQQDGF